MAFLYQMLGSKIWPPRDTKPDLTGRTPLITGAVCLPVYPPSANSELRNGFYLELRTWLRIGDQIRSCLR